MLPRQAGASRLPSLSREACKMVPWAAARAVRDQSRQGARKDPERGRPLAVSLPQQPGVGTALSPSFFPSSSARQSLDFGGSPGRAPSGTSPRPPPPACPAAGMARSPPEGEDPQPRGGRAAGGEAARCAAEAGEGPRSGGRLPLPATPATRGGAAEVGEGAPDCRAVAQAAESAE